MNKKQNKTYTKMNRGKINQMNKKIENKSYNSDSKYDGGKSINDVSWYVVSDQIGRSGANFSYSYFLGTKTPDLAVDSNTVFNGSGGRVPGVVQLNYVPMFGTSADNTSALNAALRQIYIDTRRVNSGARNYEVADLGMYILAYDQVAILIEEAKRIYRVANTMSLTNRYIPDIILRALGVDPISIRENLAQFIFGINMRIKKFSRLYVPNILPIVSRHGMLATNIFLDANTQKSQSYVFVADSLWKYSGYTNAGGTELIKTNRDITNYKTYQEVLDEIDSFLDVLLADEDTLCLMSGDMLKAFGPEKQLKVIELKEDEVQNFAYDEDVLNQIHNATFTASLVTIPNYTQSSGVVTCVPKINGTLANWSRVMAALLNSSLPFNSHKDDPDWRDNIEWSRLCVGIEAPNDLPANGAGVYTVIVGSELPTDIRHFYPDPSVSSGVKYDTGLGIILNISQFTAVNTNSALQDLRKLTNLAAYDWHPLTAVIAYDASNIKFGFAGFNFEYKYYTYLTPSERSRLNNLAILGLLGMRSNFD